MPEAPVAVPTSAPPRVQEEWPTGRPLTAEDLFRFHLISDPRPSPDGRRTAFVVTRLDQQADDYRAAVWVVGTDGGVPAQLTSGAARDSSPRWSPDGTLIAFISTRPSEEPAPPPSTSSPSTASTTATPARPKGQIWLMPVDGGEARQLTKQEHGASELHWSPDGRTIAFLSPTPEGDAGDTSSPAGRTPVADERIIEALRYRADCRGFIEDRFTQLWTIDLESQSISQLTRGPFDVAQPAWSPNGSRIAFISNRLPDHETNGISALYVVPAAGGESRPIFEENTVVTSPSWSPDGSSIAVLGHTTPHAGDAMNAKLWSVPAGGGDPACHTNSWDRSFGDHGMSDLSIAADQRPVWSIGGRSIFALASDRGATNVYRIDLDGQTVSPVTIGPRRVASFQLIPDNRLVLASGSATRPFELARFDIDSQTETDRTDFNRHLVDEVAFVEPQEINVPSPTDGQMIQGWLLTPPGFRPETTVSYPMILQIHGGPHAMYGPTPFHELQLMAARGYVVLFSNPRGSAGYGERFTSTTRGQWGESDMADVMAMVDAVLARGIVDPRRLGVTGGSYGGYLTNWIVGHTDRFAAAATQRCVSNLYSMYGTSDIGYSFGEYEFGGTPWSDTDRLLKHSPISYVDRIHTPLLIIHNEGDLRCPIEQAEQLFVALKRLGREVRFVRIPEEDHNLSRTGKPSRRLARLHHLIGWFDRYL
jgi:dipeptidyl aminopeptidase/acylaminoacyl peptidase